MKLTSLSILCFLSVAAGFQVSPPAKFPNAVITRYSSPSDVTETSPTNVKDKLLEVANKLNDDYGVFIIDSKAKDELKSAVEELENSMDPPSADDYEVDSLLGDWTLLCTTATSSSLGKGVDTSKLPFFNEGPLKNIRDSLNRCLTVVQRIRSIDNFGGINRIDNVLEYKPPASLKEILDNLPEALTSLNINPLEVIKSKVILAHKADVESGSKPLRTKLSLESIVVNVAGTSQYLEPDGNDVLGVNVPFGDFLNNGSFETTYLDKNIRVSRGKNGLVEQLRVFIRSEEDDQGYDGGDSVFEEATPEETESSSTDEPKDESGDDYDPEI